MNNTPKSPRVPPQSEVAQNAPPQSNARPSQRAAYRKMHRRTGAYLTATVVLSVILLCSVALNVYLFSRLYENASDTDASSSVDSALPQSQRDDTEESSELTEGSEEIFMQSEDTTEPIETADPFEEEIAELQGMLDSLSSDSASNSAIYNTLFELLKTENRPIHNHLPESEESSGSADSDNDKVSTGTDTTPPEPIKTPAKVSLSYLDLVTGRSFSYNGGETMNSASVIKAPYVYSILVEVERFEEKKRLYASDGTPLYDEAGNALFEGPHPNFNADGSIKYAPGEEKYDLSRVWVYDSKTMFNSGTGKIQNEKDGFSLTYLELMAYTLKYSDNIAFKTLTSTYGYANYHALARELGIDSTTKGAAQMTADDCTKFLKAMHSYMETDDERWAVVKEAMLNSEYNVMIPAAVSPADCAHKYGWDIDSYNDIAIVYTDRPFAIAIMTDLDEGRSEDYIYIQKLCRAVLAIHNSFDPAV